jgi:hypothetical protein
MLLVRTAPPDRVYKTAASDGSARRSKTELPDLNFHARACAAIAKLLIVPVLFLSPDSCCGQSMATVGDLRRQEKDGLEIVGVEFIPGNGSGAGVRQRKDRVS